MASRYLNANITKLSEKQLAEAIESLGKVANQRLRELEKGRTEGGRSVHYAEHSSAYSWVKRNVFDTEKGSTKKYIKRTKQGHLVFQRGTKNLSISEKRDELKKLQLFLKTKSSTVSGTKEVIQKSFERFNSQTALKDNPITMDTYRGFWEDAQIKHFMELFYSDINDLMQEADELKIKAEDMGKILDTLGITEKTKQKDLDENETTYEDIIEAMRIFSSSDINATEGQGIDLPEEL